MKRRRYVLGASLVAIAAATALTVSSAAFAASASAAAGPTKVDINQANKATSLGTLKFLRTTNFAASPAKPIGGPSATMRPSVDRAIPKVAGKAAIKLPSDYASTPGLPIVNAPAQVLKKTGLTGYDQEAFGGYALEPPDPEIAAGNGTIVQVVNNLVGVWDQSGNALSPPVALENFFSDSNDFLTDPKVYWDQDTKHYFLTELAIDPTFTSYSFVFIAVSQTANPLGGWNIYTMDTTDPFGNNDCPCIGDQPLLGADKWTLQISTNEFDLTNFGFNGAQMFFIDKTALALGLPNPNIVGLDFGDIGTPDGSCPTDGTGAPCWYSVQPAESPNGNYDLHLNGTSLALSALDFFGGFDNRLALWAFFNTKSISSVSPQLLVGAAIVPTGTYGAPPLGVQKSGDIPLGEAFGYDPGDVGGIETNDDRMNEVEYNVKTGRLMGGQNTGVYVPNSAHFRAGILWSAYSLHWSNGSLFIGSAKNGYIAHFNADTMFPSSATANSGNGVWAYTLTGDKLYPSSAYSGFGNLTNPSSIVVANAGKGPEDGFCEYYPPCQPGRWGDYSGAVTDGNNLFWTAEFIDQTCTFAEWIGDFTCGGERGFYINWANSINGVTVP